MTEKGMCLLCATSLETRIHALRNCTFVNTIWRVVVLRQFHYHLRSWK